MPPAHPEPRAGAPAASAFANACRLAAELIDKALLTPQASARNFRLREARDIVAQVGDLAAHQAAPLDPDRPFIDVARETSDLLKDLRRLSADARLSSTPPADLVALAGDPDGATVLAGLVAHAAVKGRLEVALFGMSTDEADVLAGLLSRVQD